jgi:hypothetical protein
LKQKYERFGKTREEILEYLSSQKESSGWAELGTSFYRDKGIISLTETKDNLLMWSHYGDQHSGMVVEFDITNDFFTSRFLSSDDKCLGKIGRVLYRKERLDKVGDYLMEPYFHKSDEWAYEKEHRLLLSIYNADENWIPTNCKDKFISSGYLKNENLSVLNPTFYKVDKFEFSNICEDPAYMAMYKLPSNAIKSVTFGCKSSPEFIDAVKSKLKSNNIENVDLFSSSIDKLDYRLKFEPEKI